MLEVPWVLLMTLSVNGTKIETMANMARKNTYHILGITSNGDTAPFVNPMAINICAPYGIRP